jgi:co-chaperonin GroES (HSP10)
MTPCTIKVLRDFIAVRLVAPPQPNPNAIQIIRAHDPLMTGEVVAIGTGVLTANGQRHPIEVKPGDLIKFDKANSIEVEHKGEKYLVLNELSIRAVLL